MFMQKSNQKVKILVSYLLQEQANLWQDLLKSQGYQVRLVSNDTDIVQILSDLPPNTLPDLLVIDSQLKSPNADSFQFRAVCEWCKTTEINIKVVVTNSKVDQIQDLEKFWVLKQGAIAILPKLSADSLMASITQIAEAVGCLVWHEPLKPILHSLQPVMSMVSKDLEQVATIKKTPELYFEQATIAFKAGRLNRTIIELDQAISINPKFAQAYILRGDTYAHLSQFPQAFDDYGQAIKLKSPEVAIALTHRGNLHFKLGNKPAAIADFNQALKLDPKLAEAYSSRGLAKFHASDEQGALKDYNQAIAINPHLAAAYNNRGILRYRTENLNAALTDYNQALAIDTQ